MNERDLTFFLIGANSFWICLYLIKKILTAKSKSSKFESRIDDYS